ncbi:g10389 [Coccomyxa viridis]|uniref:G10389 protein n=1 Tax=Coccomyxa viridis TaxID=1274662 RepID=A0ABP1G5N6_9CHLO
MPPRPERPPAASGNGQGLPPVRQKLVDASNREQVDRAIHENVLRELRKIGDTLYNDSWMYESPRCTHR